MLAFVLLVCWLKVLVGAGGLLVKTASIMTIMIQNGRPLGSHREYLLFIQDVRGRQSHWLMLQNSVIASTLHLLTYVRRSCLISMAGIAHAHIYS